MRREPLGGDVELPGEHESSGLDGLTGDGESERLGFAQQPVEAVVEPVSARGVEPAHVVAQGRSGEGVGASRDEFAQRRGNAVAPALGQPQPAPLRRLERPGGALIGLEPERTLARDQPGLVGAMEQRAARRARCRSPLRVARIGQRESALASSRAGCVPSSESSSQLPRRWRRRTRTSAARGCAVDLVGGDQHGRCWRGELGRRREVFAEAWNEARGERGGHVDVPVGDDDEQCRIELAEQLVRRGDQFVGCREPNQFAVDGIDRGAAGVAGGELCGRGEHGEAPSVESADRVVERIGREEELGEIEQVVHAVGFELARVQRCGEIVSRRLPESVRPVRASSPVQLARVWARASAAPS